MGHETQMLPYDLYGVAQAMKRRLVNAPPLHKASAEGNCERILRAVQMNNLVGHPNVRDCNNTPLHYASTFGEVPAVHILIELGAPIDAEGICGLTPIGVAARAGKSEVVQILLFYGAKLNNDRFLLACAINNTNEETCISLLKAGAIFRNQSDIDDALVTACSKEHLCLVQRLLELGADPFTKPYGTNSLISHLMSLNCSSSVIKSIFKAQLQKGEPWTPSPCKNTSKVEQRHLKI